MTARADVVVIGGGICGLAAAYRAQTAGASVIVLEAGATIGGVMRTESKGAFLVEHGPTSMAPSTASLSLLAELGLSSEIVLPPAAAKRRYVVRNGAMHALPSSPPSLLRTPLLSARGKVRLLAEPLISRRTDVEEESLGSLVRRRLGAEVLDYFVDPFVSGVCAGDADKLSSRYTLRMLGELEREHGSIIRGGIKRARGGSKAASIQSLRKGMGELPQAFGAALTKTARDVIHTNTSVTRVARAGDLWEISCVIDGVAETFGATAIVCALPAHALAAIAWPDDWREFITKLISVPYAPIATVALGFRKEQVRHPLEGFGVLFPSRERRAILGTLFNSSMFAGRAPADHHLMTAFVGGSRMAEAPTPETATRAALVELTPLLGISGRPVLTSVAAWSRGIPQLEIGHGTILEAALAIEKCAPRVFFSGSYLSGVSVADCLEHGANTGKSAAVAAVQRAHHPTSILS